MKPNSRTYILKDTSKDGYVKLHLTIEDDFAINVTQSEDQIHFSKPLAAELYNLLSILLEEG